jgi:tRNA-binding EMAP/Myf-like protein
MEGRTGHDQQRKDGGSYPVIDEIVSKRTHQVEVVRVKLEPHPDADRLEIAKIYGYTCVVGKGDFKDGDLAVYIPPDSVVPQKKEYAFLWKENEYPNGIVPVKQRRIKARKFRGIMSEGLLVSMPLECTGKPITWLEVGDDVAEMMGVTHYEAPEPISMGGDTEKTPRKPRRPKTLKGWVRLIMFKLGLRKLRPSEAEEVNFTIPTYEIDLAYQRYKNLLVENETVIITEKIDGANSRYVFFGDRMWVGSHYEWKKPNPDSIWWKALASNPEIERFCKDYPGYVVYGEVIPTQDLKYGLNGSTPKVLIFDVLNPNGAWLTINEIVSIQNDGYLVNGWVPILGVFPYDDQSVRGVVNGRSYIDGAKHQREGIVIKPLNERRDPRVGRVILKYISPEHLAKSK